MKIYVVKFLTLILALAVWVSPAVAGDTDNPSTTTDKYAAQTKAYKKSVQEWVKNVSAARTNALNTYNLVRVVVDSTTWENLTSGNTRLTLKGRILNGSGVSVNVSDLEFDFRDKSGRKLLPSSPLIKSYELAPGDYKGISIAFLGTDFGRYTDTFESGQASVRVTCSIYVNDVTVGKGALRATGEPFLIQKPRDPFWLSDKEISYIVGDAEMEAGVYGQDVEFPDRGWWPVAGQSGHHCGTLPGPKAETAPSVQQFSTYVTDGSNSESTTSNDSEDALDTVKSATETAKTVNSLARTLKSIFN